MLIRENFYLTSSIVSLLLIFSTAPVALSKVKQNNSVQVPIGSSKVNYPPVCYMQTGRGQLLDLTILCGRIITNPITNTQQREKDFGQEIRVDEIIGLADECYTTPQACFEPPDNNISPSQI